MDVLLVVTEDLTLTVAANGVDKAYARCRRKQRAIATCTKYRWDGPDPEVAYFRSDEPDLLPYELGAGAPPVFFENKDYIFEIQFADGVTSPRVYTPLKDVEDRFTHRPERNYLVGVINHGNDLGKAELRLRYERAGKTREVMLGYEVFSTKLDQQGDLLQIMADIEREYPLLVLDVLRKTFASFKAGGENRSHLVWWQVFEGIYAEFIKASRFILNKPHSRLVTFERWERADRLQVLTPKLEEELHLWRKKADHRYRTEHRALSVDTAENRFLKHATWQVERKFNKIRASLLHLYGASLTDAYKAELDGVAKELCTVRNHPLFRAVGSFSGIKQESLVLQRASGYSTIYRDWIMLQRGMDMLDDMLQMQTKNIAQLYQIWCFLEMKNILNELLGKDEPDEIRLQFVKKDKWVLKLADGDGSRIAYHRGGREVIELFHEYSITSSDGEGLASFNGEQKPDIALRIHREDLQEDYVLTYLFDAKYRLLSDDNDDAPDLPTPDALNQMHRYRDAIYYMDRKDHTSKPEKEVIGGYVLFPGEGDEALIRNSSFYKAIEQVNIGAFPLRPGDATQRKLLREHLAAILKQNTGQVLSDVRPQKRMRYEEVDPIVLVAVAQAGAHQEYLLSEGADRYHTGTKKPCRFGDARMRYFAPYFSGKGLSCYFEILGYEFMKRNAIYPKDHPLYKPDDATSRLVLKLGERKELDGGRFLKSNHVKYIRYTLFSKLRFRKDDHVDLVLSDDLPE